MMRKFYTEIENFDPNKPVSEQRVSKTFESHVKDVETIQRINRQYKVSILGKELIGLSAVFARLYQLVMYPVVIPLTGKPTPTRVWITGLRGSSKPGDQSGRLSKKTGSAQLSGPIPPPIGSQQELSGQMSPSPSAPKTTISDPQVSGLKARTKLPNGRPSSPATVLPEQNGRSGRGRPARPARRSPTPTGLEHPTASSPPINKQLRPPSSATSSSRLPIHPFDDRVGKRPRTSSSPEPEQRRRASSTGPEATISFRPINDEKRRK